MTQRIVLTTINAKYIHASLGLRYLYANLRDLQQQATLHEYTLSQRADDIAESILSENPRIVGFGVYIWNVDLTLDVIRLINVIAPDVVIVIGGPEVSHELNAQAICKAADHIITGQADVAFADLCRDILKGEARPPIISALPLELDQLATPYPFYTSDDLAHRVLYVEASRGCPFKCEFCLSSLDKTATPFDLDRFLEQMQLLIERGARNFKFVDRTFNLKAETSRRILSFFLEHQNELATNTANPSELFLHFELIPDRLPAPILDLLPQFRPGTLQFEIGIQSFNPDVQQLISRRQQHEQTCANLKWLREHTHAHIHADLIVGLPGESLDSLGEGFNLLQSLGPQEIQVGILKRLRGTPIDRHTDAYEMRYAPDAPYRILSNRDLDFRTLQRLVRFARYWDLLGNSGRFPTTLPLLLGEDPFRRFLAFSDWLFDTTDQTHKISLHRWFDFLDRGLPEALGLTADVVRQALSTDFEHNALKGRPAFLKQSNEPRQNKPGQAARVSAAQRQKRHRNIEGAV